MFKNKILFVFILSCFFGLKHGAAQEFQKKLSLGDVIELAQSQSPQAFIAKHQFRASYWGYKSFKATLRPNLSLSGNLPRYSREYSRIEVKDETTGKLVYKYAENNSLSPDLNLRVGQKIGLTGGEVYMSSRLTGIYNLDDESELFSSTPIGIGIEQPILGFNALRWQKKIEPLKYEEAKKKYVQDLEQVNINAVQYYFDLMLAQRNMEIVEMNYANSDTLYKIAQGRYKIGTIAENELLQMELNHLNTGIRLNEANVDLEFQKSRLRSFLGFNQLVEITLDEPDSVLKAQLDYQRVLELARENNPEYINNEISLIQADRDVADAKGKRGLSARLNLEYGLAQTAKDFSGAYKDPSRSQAINVGLTLPIVDWGTGRGGVKMAESRRELYKTQINQAVTDFERDVFVSVMRFNIQADQVYVSSKAEYIAERSYDISKHRFMAGKIDVLKLNTALKDKDEAKRSHISVMRTFWTNYYQMRKLCLFDFEKNEKIDVNFELLID